MSLRLFKKNWWLFFFVFFLEDCSILQFFKKKEKITEGLSYSYYATKDGEKIHLVRIDTNLYSPQIIRAKQNGLSKLSEITNTNKYPIAINGSFFEEGGRPSGALKINGKWQRKPIRNRGVFAWKKEKGNLQFYFDRLSSQKNLIISHKQKNQWFKSTPNIIGGTPLLIYQGKKTNFNQEKVLKNFITRPYGRSAVALHKDRKTLFFVLVEGGDKWTYKLGLKDGMSLSRLADFLLKKGCEFALNLDGGYSSSLMIKNKLIRYPFFSLLEEREISNILVVKRK